MEPAVPSDVPVPAGESGGAALVRLLVRQLLPAFCAAGVAFLLNTYVLLPWLGVGPLQRIVALRQHLRQPFAQKTLAFLGNSIVGEGIDASVITEAAPSGWRAENLSVSGCVTPEVQLMLPAVIAARPAAIAYPIRPWNLGTGETFDLDKAYVYAYAGFADDWPGGTLNADSIPGLSPPVLEALQASPFRRALHFRTAALEVMEDRVRHALRKTLRTVSPDDFVHPFARLSSVHDSRLTQHLKDISEGARAGLKDGFGRGREDVERTLHAVQKAGVQMVLVLAPIHPAMVADFAEDIARMRAFAKGQAGENVLVIDAVDLLGAEEFGDAVHPNEAGRRKFSAFVGQQLPAAPLLSDPR